MGKNKGIRQARADRELLARALPADFGDAADVLDEIGTSVPLARSLPVQLAAALCREQARAGGPVKESGATEPVAVVVQETPE